MEKILLKSKNRITEVKGALSIRYCYDSEKYNIPYADDFKNIISIKDCEIKPNMGILPHRHENIELITVLLKGTLVQKNNLGETCLLTPGKIQVLSTGTGVSHFEYNKSDDTTLNCIQFYISPQINYTTPKSKILSLETNKKGFQKIIPAKKNPNATQILEGSYLYYGLLETNTRKTYRLKNKKKRILILNISGEMEVNGEMLIDRDILVIRNIPIMTIISKKTSQFFFFEA